MGMGSRVPVDDFSVMTGLSRDELRQYRDLGLLDPWHTDAHTGYRLYDTTQVHLAHTIRGLRAGGMAIADLKSLLCTDDLNWRNTHIAAQQSDVWSDLGPVKPTRARVPISLRREAPMSAWAVTATVSKPDLAEWITESLRAVHTTGGPGPLPHAGRRRSTTPRRHRFLHAAPSRRRGSRPPRTS
jgi:DNA-binding transcriptional MerR regulator